MKIFQLTLGLLFLGLAIYSFSKGDTDRFYADLILANIWIAASQITSKIDTK